jgi:para-nitrobenzyl esterase
MCTRQGCSEDCLYLNVFTAKNSTEETTASGDLLPVALFVHGGSYKSGSSNLYPAGELANYWDGKAIVVTINYRLNVFGFLGSESLRSLDTNDGSTGNQGIQDQRLAMQWVRDNIKAFGGDASKVMIFGESAGAGSMTMHLTMKKSFGLYRRAILESGSFTQWSMQSMQHAQSSFDAFLAQTTCSNSGDDDKIVSCLQSLSTEAVNNAMAAMDMPSVPENDPYFPFSPTADGVEATTAAWIAAADGDVNDVPILHGYVSTYPIAFVVLPFFFSVYYCSPAVFSDMA